MISVTADNVTGMATATRIGDGVGTVRAKTLYGTSTTACVLNAEP